METFRKRSARFMRSTGVGLALGLSATACAEASQPLPVLVQGNLCEQPIPDSKVLATIGESDLPSFLGQKGPMAQETVWKGVSQAQNQLKVDGIIHPKQSTDTDLTLTYDGTKSSKEQADQMATRLVQAGEDKGVFIEDADTLPIAPGKEPTASIVVYWHEPIPNCESNKPIGVR